MWPPLHDFFLVVQTLFQIHYFGKLTSVFILHCLSWTMEGFSNVLTCVGGLVLMA